ncbi:MAG: GTP 3',8-cyclase MoaA [Ferruginibacter sp.]
MITDRYNRPHNYLRISLTDNCNMRCFYCMPDEDYEFTPASKLMQANEIIAIAKTFVSLGVNKIRLTGGEPLVRKDAAEIITALGKLPVKLTLTTNGSRIHEFIDLLEQSGVHSLNISLDTLQSDKFLMITKRNQFDLVKNNIELLLKRNFHVKINVVVMKGMNDNEINDFVAWTKQAAVHVRFIEFMPFEGNRWTSNKVFTLHEILDTVRSVYEIETLENDLHDTSKAFKVVGHAGTFAIISTMTEPFCSGCNRIRLTADGKIKNCLFSKEETDLLTAFRNEQDIIPLINQSIQNKFPALGGQLNTDFEHLHAAEIKNRSMITIGG